LAAFAAATFAALPQSNGCEQVKPSPPMSTHLPALHSAPEAQSVSEAQEMRGAVETKNSCAIIQREVSLSALNGFSTEFAQTIWLALAAALRSWLRVSRSRQAEHARAAVERDRDELIASIQPKDVS